MKKHTILPLILFNQLHRPIFNFNPLQKIELESA